MPTRKVKFRQSEIVLLPDIHHYLLLIAGEALKLNGHSNGPLLRLAIKCASAVVSRAVSTNGDVDRIVIPIANLAIGHAYYLHQDMDRAVTFLYRSRAQFHALPNSPLKQFYLGRCVCLLVESHAWLGRFDREFNVWSDAQRLFRGFLNLIIAKAPDRRRFLNRADTVLLKLAHPPSVWYEQCLYDIVEITATYLHINQSTSPDPHYAKLVALLMSMPAEKALGNYRIEREFAMSLTYHSKMAEALPLWRRLLLWKDRLRYNEEEEEDLIRFRIMTCLVGLGRAHHAKAELSKMDIARSLIHYKHGPSLLYLARRMYYQLGEFDKLLELCRSYQDVCDAKFKPNDIVPLMNRYYCARILKRLGRYGEATKRYRAFISIVQITSELVSGDMNAVEIDSPRTLQGLLSEGYRGLAHALRLQDRVECIFQYRKALHFGRTEVWPDFRMVRGVLKSLAYLYESTHDTQNAIVAYDLLHRQYLRKHISDPMAMIKYSWYRGKMFLLMGKHEFALELFRQAQSTCAAKRMENAKTRWPTPAELALARRTIESEDEEEQEPTPIPEGDTVQVHTREEEAEEAVSGPSKLEPEDDGVSRPADVVMESNPTGPTHEPTKEDLDVEDRSPFGPWETMPQLSACENDRWWARAIEASIAVAERGGTVEDPVPIDHYDSDFDDAAPGADEPKLADESFVADPVGKRRDELREPRFEALPGTFKEYKEARAEIERYPWRRGIF